MPFLSCLVTKLNNLFLVTYIFKRLRVTAGICEMTCFYKNGLSKCQEILLAFVGGMTAGHLVEFL